MTDSSYSGMYGNDEKEISHYDIEPEPESLIVQECFGTVYEESRLINGVRRYFAVCSVCGQEWKSEQFNRMIEAKHQDKLDEYSMGFE